VHETAIIDALLEQVRSFVPPGAVLRQVCIDVGGLEHLDAEIMQTAWSALTAGTEAAGSTLRISRVAVRVRCDRCGHVYEPQDTAILLCPECETARPRILSGAGVLLRSIDVDQPAEVEAP
jgi:hydrogenase nickel incorporation protein HypA/HybF